MLTLSILLVALYVGAAIWKERELPESISAMVYVLPKQEQWLWTLWIWAITLLLAPTLFDTIGEDFGAVAHCFATSMMFVGAMPLIRNETNKAHNALGIAAGIFSQVCVVIINPWWLMTWFVLLIIPFCDRKWYVPGLPMWMIRSRIFIVESVCTIPLYGALFIH